VLNGVGGDRFGLAALLEAKEQINLLKTDWNKWMLYIVPIEHMKRAKHCTFKAKDKPSKIMAIRPALCQT
jgi:hypothetical protein